MPPKKNDTRTRAKTQQLKVKPKKGVTKKLPKATRKAKTLPTADLCIISHAYEIGTVLPKSRAEILIDKAKNELKIMRANEVLKTVFKKKSNAKSIRPVTVPTVQVRTRGRTKKINCEIIEQAVMDAKAEPTHVLENNEPIQDVAKKKVVNSIAVRTRKRSAIAEVLVNDIEQQAVQPNVLTEETPRKRKKMIPSRKTTKAPEGDVDGEKVTAINGKEEIQGSPSIIDNTVHKHTEETDVETKANNLTQPQDQNIIKERKDSSASASTCLSWTKDISSSSTITCVTVQSNDFVRIDKKLPYIKLTNIDDIAQRKDTNDNIYEEKSFDNHRLNRRSKCGSECSVFSAADLNVSQTLNLSTSSMTSARTSETNQNNAACKKNITVKKLQRSLDNLSSKMKNFDLEMINWIGYDNESKDANAKKCHDRIFEILKEENDVIKYCREIKKVLDVDQELSAEVNDTEPNNINETTQPQPDSNISSDILENIDCNSNEKVVKLKETETGKDSIKDVNNSSNHLEISEDDKLDLEGDNEDDDAISLFADTMVDTEYYDDFDVSPPTKRDKFLANERVCQSTQQRTTEVVNSVERYEKVYPTIICEKHTADSSSNYNIVSDSNTVNRFENIDDETANDYTPVSNRLKFINSTERETANGLLNFSSRFGGFGNNNKNFDMPVNFNKTFAGLENIQIRAPVNSFGQRFTEIQNTQNIHGVLKNLPDNLYRSYGEFLDVSRTPSNVPQNCNDGPSDSTSKGSMIGAENPSYTVDQTKSSPLLPTPKGNKQGRGAGSGIFKNVCVFNLASYCKNVVCPFQHVKIEIDAVESELQTLNEDVFIRECKFMLNWTVLRRKYGCCYVKECIRRDMTWWVLPLTLFIIQDGLKFSEKNRDDSRMELVEVTLLHLNNINLDVCGEHLRTKIAPNTLLCDYFMKVISETPNFSRFKIVFIKLTAFVCQIRRSFKLDVASQVLERLCILPYDEALASAMIRILERTDQNIFSSPMMGLFENQLLKNEAQLHERLMALKGQSVTTNLTHQSPHISPLISPNVQNTPTVRADSPDTTNVDSMNKKVEPVITRTITINRTIRTSNINVKSPSETSDDVHRSQAPEPRQLQPQKRWRSFCPSVLSRPHRHVYKHWPRPQYGNTPNVRRPPPHENF